MTVSKRRVVHRPLTAEEFLKGLRRVRREDLKHKYGIPETLTVDEVYMLLIDVIRNGVITNKWRKSLKSTDGSA